MQYLKSQFEDRIEMHEKELKKLELVKKEKKRDKVFWNSVNFRKRCIEILKEMVDGL